MSAYAKLPSQEPQTKPETRAAAALDQAEKIAGTLGKGIGGGLRDASQALGAPKGTDVEGLIGGTDLPELEGEDALRDLAARLDREGDLWRNLAFRELANARWTQKMLQIVAGLLVLVTGGLAIVAAIGALFGAAPERAILLGSGALVLAVGTLLFALIVSVVRRGQRETVREALARADLAELRLHRVAISIAERQADPSQAKDVLAKLASEARG
ncbi:MAG: hypothetical protein IT378_24410 [Sandaracinaceae bacterium]|nr:hypothetical protein [Sandaracinaceae bacterium]